MKILVFTTKPIGLNCLKFAMQHFPQDEYTILVCEPGADEIIAELNKLGCQASRVDEASLNEIRAKPARHYDWLLNLWGGHVFKDDILAKVVRSLNIHPSYLPYCRGRDPIVWTIRYGYPAGVSLHAITNGVDEGPIWYQEKLSYQLPCTGGELYTRVVDRAYEVFCENWPRLRESQQRPEPQVVEGEGRTFRRAELGVDRRINLDADSAARAVFLRLLAHDFGDDYQAEVVIDGKVYGARLQLTPKPSTSQDT